FSTPTRLTQSLTRSLHAALPILVRSPAPPRPAALNRRLRSGFPLRGSPPGPTPRSQGRVDRVARTAPAGDGWPRDRGASFPVSEDRKSTRLNSSHGSISYAVFCF